MERMGREKIFSSPLFLQGAVSQVVTRIICDNDLGAKGCFPSSPNHISCPSTCMPGLKAMVSKLIGKFLQFLNGTSATSSFWISQGPLAQIMQKLAQTKMEVPKYHKIVS